MTYIMLSLLSLILKQGASPCKLKPTSNFYF